MYFPPCFLSISLYSCCKNEYLLKKSLSVYSSLTVSPSFCLVQKGKMQSEGPGRSKGVVEGSMILYLLIPLNIYLAGKVFAGMVDYFITSQITA